MRKLLAGCLAATFIIGVASADVLTPQVIKPAGTSSSNAVAVQGVSGGVALPISGTVAVGSIAQLPAALDASGYLKVHEQGTATIAGTVTVTDGAGALNVIVDSGTTTVTQATGTNLHAVLDSGSTTACTQATASNLNATVVQATGSNLHTVVDSGAVTVSDGAGALNVIIDSGTTVVTQSTASSLNTTAVVTDGTDTLSIQTHNAAAAGNAAEVLGAIGRSAVAASTAGRSTALSTDTTTGALNMRLTDATTYTGAVVGANDTLAASNGLVVMPAISRTAPAIVTGTRMQNLSVLTTNGGVFSNITGGAGQLVADVQPTNTAALGNMLEVAPAAAQSAVVAATAGRAVSLSVDSTNGGLNARIVDSATYLSPSVLANDTTAIANGLGVQPAVARATGTAVTAGRGEMLQIQTTGGGLMIAGDVASDAVDLGNPVKVGHVGRTALVAAVAALDRVDSMSDVFGRAIVLPQGPRDLAAQNTVTLTTTTSETTLLAATASTYHDLTMIACRNSSATQVNISVRDDTAGTVRLTLTLAANGGGDGYVFNYPFTQTATNKNWTVQSSGSVTSVFCDVQAVSNK